MISEPVLPNWSGGANLKNNVKNVKTKLLEGSGAL